MLSFITIFIRGSLSTGYLQCTIGQGTRSSAATSYLGAGVLKRSNLYVLLNTQVTRVLPDTARGAKTPSFRKVEITLGSFGNFYLSLL